MKHLPKLSIALFSVMLLSPLASAQDSEGGATTLEEITVTAQRREQSTMDVPISITAFGEEIINQNNMKGAADYLAATPNVSFTDSQREGPRGISIAIRGISDLQNAERVSATSSFGVYVDEFSTATAARGTSNPPLYDVERIEILRGPQGTYFGRNATGGAINVTTKKPTDELYAQVDVGVGSFETFEVGGVLNIPLSDTFFVRAAMYSESNGGQVENVSPLSDGGDSGYDDRLVRIAAHWDINDEWAADFSASSITENSDMSNTVAIGLQGRFGSDLDDPLYTCGLSTSTEDEACRDTTGFTDLEDEVLNLRLTYTGENLGFKSITGRTTSSMNQLFDLDQSGRPWVDRKNDYKAESVSQEFRLYNLGSDRLEWTVGALVYSDELVANNEILILDFLGPWMAGDSANENTINMKRDGWGAFADFTWHLNDTMNVSLGARYSDDEEEQLWSNVFAGCGRRAVGDPLDTAAGCALRPDQLNGPLPVIDGSISGGRRPQTIGTFVTNDDSDFSPRLAFNWNINEDWTSYGVVSQGYKAAGARANPDSGGVNSSIYDREKLTNYEIGVKAALNEGRTRVEAAIFSMVWDDFQTTLRETFCREADGSLRPQIGNENCEFVPLDRIQNAEEASAKGIEVNVETLVGEHWQLGVSYGYLDAKYEDFRNAILGGTVTDVSGLPLPDAPENTASLRGTYSFDLASANGYVRLEANYRDTVFNLGGLTDPLMAVHPFTPDDYWVVNLRAGLEWENQRLSFGVNNLLDEDYAAGVGSGSAGVTVRPREPVFNLRWTAWTK